MELSRASVCVDALFNAYYVCNNTQTRDTHTLIACNFMNEIDMCALQNDANDICAHFDMLNGNQTAEIQCMAKVVLP